MAHFAVTYTYGPDKATQDENRPAHRAYLATLHEQGELIASGPLLETQPGKALFIFQADSADAVRELLSHDPFQKLGQVSQVDVLEWNPVIGIFAGK